MTDRLAFTDSTLTASGSVKMVVLDVDAKSEEAGWPNTLGGTSGAATSISWSPDRQKLAVARQNSPRLTVIDVTTKTVETGWPTLAGLCRGVAWSPDSSRLACYGDASPYLQVVDAASKSIESGWATASAAPTDNGRCLAWSPDGDRLALFTSAFVSPGYDVYDVASKTKETGWPAVTQNFSVHGAFSPDGTMLAVLSGTSTANRRLFVIGTSSKTVDTSWPTFSAATQSCKGVSWSPDSSRLAVGRVGSAGVNHLQVIDAASKALESGWPAGTSSLAAVMFSPDGTYLATAYLSAAKVEIITVSSKAVYAPPWVGLVQGSQANDLAWFPASAATRGLIVGSMSLGF